MIPVSIEVQAREDWHKSPVTIEQKKALRDFAKLHYPGLGFPPVKVVTVEEAKQMYPDNPSKAIMYNPDGSKIELPIFWERMEFWAGYQPPQLEAPLPQTASSSMTREEALYDARKICPGEVQARVDPTTYKFILECERFKAESSLGWEDVFNQFKDIVEKRVPYAAR